MVQVRNFPLPENSHQMTESVLGQRTVTAQPSMSLGREEDNQRKTILEPIPISFQSKWLECTCKQLVKWLTCHLLVELFTVCKYPLSLCVPTVLILGISWTKWSRSSLPFSLVSLFQWDFGSDFIRVTTHMGSLFFSTTWYTKTTSFLHLSCKKGWLRKGSLPASHHLHC